MSAFEHLMTRLVNAHENSWTLMEIRKCFTRRDMSLMNAHHSFPRDEDHGMT